MTALHSFLPVRNDFLRRPAVQFAAIVMVAVLGTFSVSAFAQATAGHEVASAGGSETPDTGFTARDMLSRLNQPWVQLIDVRSAAEFYGQDVRALRGGHIPGAISFPDLDQPATASTSTTTPASATAVIFALRLADLDRRKETIVYGNGAADAAVAAELLERNGFRQVRRYAAGWPAWANALELPVSSERFADVGLLRRQIDELQRALAQQTGQAERIAINR